MHFTKCFLDGKFYVGKTKIILLILLIVVKLLNNVSLIENTQSASTIIKISKVVLIITINVADAFSSTKGQLHLHVITFIFLVE